MSTNVTRAQRMDAHRIAMKLRRARQLEREPGFTPVVNKRLAAAVQGVFATLAVASAEAVARGHVTVTELQDRAVKRVAEGLPRERMVFDWRNQGATRNNDAAYRKAPVA